MHKYAQHDPAPPQQQYPDGATNSSTGWSTISPGNQFPVQRRPRLRRKKLTGGTARVLAHYPTAADLQRIEATVADSVSVADALLSKSPKQQTSGQVYTSGADAASLGVGHYDPPIRLLRAPRVATTLPVTVMETPGRTPPPREGHTLVSLGSNRSLIFGGTDGIHVYNDVWLLEPVNDRTQIRTLEDGSEELINEPEMKWRRIRTSGDVPPARYGHSCCYWRGKMLVYGGCFGGKIQVNNNATSTEEEDVTNDKPLPVSLLSSVFILNINTWTWHQVNSPTKVPLKNHSAVICGNLMYIFGGCLSDKTRSNYVHVFDCVNECWTNDQLFNPQLFADSSRPALQHTAHEIPLPRSGHSCVVWNPNRAGGSPRRRNHQYGSEDTLDDVCMITFGGRLAKYTFSAETHSYNVTSRLWQKLNTNGTSPSPRSSHSAQIYGDCMFVAGGYCHQQTTRVLYNQVYMLQLRTFTWWRINLPGPVKPLPRCGHSTGMLVMRKGWGCLLCCGGWAQVQNQESTTDTETDVTSTPMKGAAHPTVKPPVSEDEDETDGIGASLDQLYNDFIDDAPTSYRVVFDVLAIPLIPSRLPPEVNRNAFFRSPTFDIRLLPLGAAYQQQQMTLTGRDSRNSKDKFHHHSSGTQGTAASLPAQSPGVPLFPHYHPAHPVRRLSHTPPHLKDYMHSPQTQPGQTAPGLTPTLTPTPPPYPYPPVQTSSPPPSPHRRRLFHPPSPTPAATPHPHQHQFSGNIAPFKESRDSTTPGPGGSSAASGLLSPTPTQTRSSSPGRAKPWGPPGAAFIPEHLDTVLDISRVRRNPTEVETIVSRLTDTMRSDNLKKALEAKYLPVSPPKRHRQSDVHDTLSRLYYEQMVWKEEKEKYLEQKWLTGHGPKPKGLSKEAEELLVKRLYSVKPGSTWYADEVLAAGGVLPGGHRASPQRRSTHGTEDDLPA